MSEMVVQMRRREIRRRSGDPFTTVSCSSLFTAPLLQENYMRRQKKKTQNKTMRFSRAQCYTFVRPPPPRRIPLYAFRPALSHRSLRTVLYASLLFYCRYTPGTCVFGSLKKVARQSLLGK